MKYSFASAKLPAVLRCRTAVIQDPVEIRDILAHLVRTGRPPPGFDLMRKSHEMSSDSRSRPVFTRPRPHANAVGVALAT
jgi:hypothetical protein